MVEEPSICQCRRRRLSPWVGKIGWRRAWQPAPVFLPGESCGQRSLAGCSLWGRRVGRDGARTWGRLPVLCHTLALLFESLLAWPPETAGRLEGTDRPPHRSCGAAGTSFEAQPQGGAAPCFGFAPSTCTCGGGAGVGMYELLAPSRQRSSREDGEQLQHLEGGSPRSPDLSGGRFEHLWAYEQERRRPGAETMWSPCPSCARLSRCWEDRGQDIHSPPCAF